MIDFEQVQSLFGTTDLMDMKEVMHDLVCFQDLSRKDIKAMSDWLAANGCKYNQVSVVLYHGTLATHDIKGQGIKRTTSRNKRSLQSTPGYVYLSLYPSTAKTFAEMGYPNQAVSVYAVRVPVRDLLADHDQLKNARMWKNLDFDIKSTVGDSLVVGSGARVKRDVMPYDIRKITL